MASGNGGCDHCIAVCADMKRNAKFTKSFPVLALLHRKNVLKQAKADTGNSISGNNTVDKRHSAIFVTLAPGN